MQDSFGYLHGDRRCCRMQPNNRVTVLPFNDAVKPKVKASATTRIAGGDAVKPQLKSPNRMPNICRWIHPMVQLYLSSCALPQQQENDAKLLYRSKARHHDFITTTLLLHIYPRHIDIDTRQDSRHRGGIQGPTMDDSCP